MPKKQRPEWAFTNQLGHEITTGDPGTAEKYRHDPLFDEVTKTDENGDPDPAPYAKRKKGDLEAEIAARNVGRSEDTLLPTTGSVSELASALDADDATVTP